MFKVYSTFYFFLKKFNLTKILLNARIFMLKVKKIICQKELFNPTLEKQKENTVLDLEC